MAVLLASLNQWIYDIPKTILHGGGIAGGRSAIEHPDVVDKQELGREAGRNFVKNNLGAILLTSLGGSFVISVAVSFSGVLPWCRKPPEPPPLP
jgi:hypothetical protein